MAKKPKASEYASEDMDTPVVPSRAAAEEEEAPKTVALAAKPAAAPAAKPAGKLKQWRVLKAKKVVVHGHMTTMPAGEIISAASYGEIGMARLLEQNLELEEV